MTDDRQSADQASGNDGFSNVLVVWDETEQDRNALRLASDMAAAAGGRLAALGLFERNAGWSRLAEAAAAPVAEAEAQMQTEMEQKMRAHLAQALPDISDVDIGVRAGKPFLEIIRHVIEKKIDLLIKTADRRSGLQGHLFSSADQHLLRKCPCPVWLRLADAPRPAKTVLAAVDVDDDAAKQPEIQRGLNARIMETALAIAAVEGAALHVVHVWDAPAEALLRRWLPDDKDAKTYVRNVHADHEYALRKLLEGFETADGPAVAPHLERGDARTVIPTIAASLKADILVMGTVGRTGVPGLIIGNTAEDILNSADCSVVTVKPPGYKSPVGAV